MEKTKICIEHPLASKSMTIVWGLVGSASGLQKWLADYVTENGDELVFTWGEPWTQREQKVAHVLDRVKNKHLRIRWDSYEEHEYLELRIEKSELTGLLSLLITDFAEPEDVDYIRDLWDKNLRRLHHVSGI